MRLFFAFLGAGSYPMGKNEKEYREPSIEAHPQSHLISDLPFVVLG